VPYDKSCETCPCQPVCEVPFGCVECKQALKRVEALKTSHNRQSTPFKNINNPHCCRKCGRGIGYGHESFCDNF